MFLTSKFKLPLCVLLLIPVFSMASTLNQPVNYSFLKNGFNMQSYKICDQQLKKCAEQGRPSGFLAEACVKKILPSTPDCNQLNKLSEKIDGILGFITAKASVNNFAIITQIYPADGQEEHYIISPLGYLVKTNIDPRLIDADLKKQYEKVDFYTKTNGDVETEIKRNTILFTVPLQITKTCSACEGIGKAKIQFNFSKNGKLIKITLTSFEKENEYTKKANKN